MILIPNHLVAYGIMRDRQRASVDCLRYPVVTVIVTLVIGNGL